MAGSDTKQRSVSYWKAASLQSRCTLQEAVKAAMSLKPEWADRVNPMASAQSPDASLFLNAIFSAHGMTFGQLVMFEAGRHHQALRIAPKSKSLDLVEVAPTNEGERAEFLESVMYFGIGINHIVLLQSQSLRSRDLENYLNWFLQSSGAYSEDDGLTLHKGVSLATKEKIAKDPPSKIRIGTPLFNSKRSVDEDANAQNEGFDRKRLRLGGGIWGYLNRLSGESLDSLRLDDSVDPDSIRVFVEVSYRRKKDSEAGKIMEDLTHSLRHLHEDDLTVTLPKTGKIKGSVLYLSTTLSVAASNGNVVEQSLFKGMSDWLASLLNTGIIEG